MPSTIRHLISINDLTNSDIERIFDLADGMCEALERKETLDICKGKILSTLFYEPSTRTRLSFESAMCRLGGSVISMADAKTSSVAKGETIADTVRVVQSYADVVVMRHPKDGSTVVAGDHSGIPVISGGDGQHEHPTQTLCDLYTIRKRLKRLEGVSVALYGDLRHGRTVHSLALGLARFGAKMAFVSPKGFEMPGYVVEILKNEYGLEVPQHTSLDEVCIPDVIYQADAHRPPQTQEEFFVDRVRGWDVIYITRVQKERMPEADRQFAQKYQLTLNTLKKAKDDTMVMHPLPRLDELSVEIDRDQRAAYFDQAKFGVPIRMALLVLMLGAEPLRRPRAAVDENGSAANGKPLAVMKLRSTNGLPDCVNENCVTRTDEPVKPAYVKLGSNDRDMWCRYCGVGQPRPPTIQPYHHPSHHAVGSGSHGQ